VSWPDSPKGCMDLKQRSVKCYVEKDAKIWIGSKAKRHIGS
jgi:hypothetical protein